MEKSKSLEDLTVKELLALLGSRSVAEQKQDVARRVPSDGPGGSLNRLIPVTEWNQHHSWPPPGGLRWLIFNEETNGFHHVVRRVGRRVLIDEAAFFDWVRAGGRGQEVGTVERRRPKRSS